MGMEAGMATEPSHEHLSCDRRAKRRARARRGHLPLFAWRTRSPLARRPHLYLLPYYRSGILVSLYVLAGHLGRGRTNGPLLASLVRRGLHVVSVLDVQDVDWRHAHHRRRPALVESHEALHRK